MRKNFKKLKNRFFGSATLNIPSHIASQGKKIKKKTLHSFVAQLMAVLLAIKKNGWLSTEKRSSILGGKGSLFSVIGTVVLGKTTSFDFEVFEYPL